MVIEELLPLRRSRRAILDIGSTIFVRTGGFCRFA